MPTNATPIVAAVVQELPVHNETNEQIKHDVIKKNLGLIISIP